MDFTALAAGCHCVLPTASSCRDYFDARMVSNREFTLTLAHSYSELRDRARAQVNISYRRRTAAY